MAPITALTTASSQLDSSQTFRASSALLKKISTDASTKTTSADNKSSLLADADDGLDSVSDLVPIWLILTTKKHIVDKKRLKPSQLALPHPYLSITDPGLRVCLITADPQRKYKELVEVESGFPEDVAGVIKRVIGLEKLKGKYKSFESRRQLFSEYDVFLADDRIITYLPKVLGKVFYDRGSKRPIPVSLEGKRQSVDEKGEKRKKLAEGGEKVKKSEPQPKEIAEEIKRAVGSALVHLAPSTTTAVKVGVATNTPEELQANVEAVVEGLVEKFVPQKWDNVRAVHIKGPETIALPIWLTEELWASEQDVLEFKPETNAGKKRKRSALIEEGKPETIEVPGPDGQMRVLEKPGKKGKKVEKLEVDVVVPAKKEKKRKSEPVVVETVDEDVVAKLAEKAAKLARKEERAALKAAEAGAHQVEVDEDVKPKKKAKKSKA